VLIGTSLIAKCPIGALVESITEFSGNIFADDFSEQIKNFQSGAQVFAKQVPDPERFGCPVFDQHDSKKVLRIEEKPAKAPSPYAVTGVYLCDSQVFDYIRSIERSARGQLEITDVNNRYIDAGTMRWEPLEGYWNDAGTFDSLFAANAYWAKKAQSKTRN